LSNFILDIELLRLAFGWRGEAESDQNFAELKSFSLEHSTSNLKTSTHLQSSQ
jgi:hypothetical protein